MEGARGALRWNTDGSRSRCCRRTLRTKRDTTASASSLSSSMQKCKNQGRHTARPLTAVGQHGLEGVLLNVDELRDPRMHANCGDVGTYNRVGGKHD